jgi:hypothetical protein
MIMIQCRECERLRAEVKNLSAYIRLHQQERRVRPAEFAKELNISLRVLREIFTLGAPVIKVQGIVWINPEKFYAWLDGFERKGRPGVKGHRGLKVVA